MGLFRGLVHSPGWDITPSRSWGAGRGCFGESAKLLWYALPFMDFNAALIVYVVEVGIIRCATCDMRAARHGTRNNALRTITDTRERIDVVG